MRALGLVLENIKMEPDGRLRVSDINGNTRDNGVFDLNRNTPTMITFLEEFVHPYVKIYSFADSLKQDVCIDLLGLTYEQCYGTDDQKNSFTNLNWKNMPCKPGHSLTSYGEMTAREVMQYVGTDIFRKMYNNVWVDATINRINRENTGVALICDCRFPNEVEGVQKAGGTVIRQTRTPFPEDSHYSETALDPENFDWSKFDTILDNQNMNIDEQCIAVEAIVTDLNLWPPHIQQQINKEELLL